MRILRRREALAEGLTRYYTGKPCCHGHYSERRASDGRCLACEGTFAYQQRHREYASAWYKANAEQARESGPQALLGCAKVYIVAGSVGFPAF